MKTIHTLALTTLAAAMAAGSAFAQQPTSPPPTSPPQTQEMPPQTQPAQPRARTAMQDLDHDKKPSYEELNVRGDGRVTRADLAGHPRLLEKFDDIDTDGDGTISRSEYDAWKSQKKDGDDRRSDY